MWFEAEAGRRDALREGSFMGQSCVIVGNSKAGWISN